VRKPHLLKIVYFQTSINQIHSKEKLKIMRGDNNKGEGRTVPSPFY